MNAVTSVARDTRDPELRWRLEEFGGGIPVAMPERDPGGPPRGGRRAGAGLKGYHRRSQANEQARHRLGHRLRHEPIAFIAVVLVTLEDDPAILQDQQARHTLAVEVIVTAVRLAVECVREPG